MARRPNMPNAENCSFDELVTAANCAPSKKSHVRLMCVKALIQGITHDQVAALFAKSRRTIQNWVRRFNEQGIDGLIEKKSPGAPRRISKEQTQQYSKLIEEPKRAGEAHWTAKKFHGFLRREFEHEVGYRTVVRWLHEQNFALKVPRPWPDKQDEALRQVFLGRLRQWLGDHHIDLWYMDEVGVEGDPRPRRRWALKGEKTRVTRNGSHVRMNATGMICPRTGEFYALEFSHSDSVAFQVFLDHANADVTVERPRNLLICDNASWHKNKSIRWGVFEPVFLPPYSPDLNPIERLWLVMKAEWFRDHISKDRESLIKRLDKALCWLMGRKQDNSRTCAIRK